MRFFVEGIYSEEAIHSFLEKDDFHYAVCLKETGEIVGKLTLHDWFMKDTYELGWIFLPEHQNRGYCTESSYALLQYAFESLKAHRIVATCQPENISSRRVCEKIGMRLEGTFLQCIHVKDDLWWDELFFAMLREEYEKRTKN